MMGNLSNVQQLLRTTENSEENQNEEKTAIKELNQEQTGDKKVKCSICQETAKANNRLVHLAHVYKGKSVCGAIYGQHCKSSTLITTCKHPVHTNCYIDIKK